MFLIWMIEVEISINIHQWIGVSSALKNSLKQHNSEENIERIYYDWN